MKFYYPPADQTLQRLTSQPLFAELIAFLQERPENSVILRELKQAFPQRDFEKQLEQLVQAQLIIREKRRYRIAFPIFEPEQPSAAEQNLLAELQQQLLNLKAAERLTMLNQIWQTWLPAGKNYFFAAADTVAFYQQYSVGNQELRFMVYEKQDCCPLSIINYFDLLAKNSQLPEVLQPLEDLLGDVDPEYYFNQVQSIWERIRDGRGAKVRESIFLKSLRLTQMINEDASALLLVQAAEETIALSEAAVKLTPQTDSRGRYLGLQRFAYLAAGLALEKQAFYQLRPDAPEGK